MQHLMTRLAGLRAKLASEKILLFLDYDGTLVPLVGHPSGAPLGGALHRLLAKLTRLPGVSLAFVSGRSLADLESEVNLKNVFYAGNHGFEVKGAGGNRLSPRWNVLCRGMALLAPQISQAFRGFRGICLEDKKFTLSVHYKGLAPAKIKPVFKHLESALKGAMKLFPVSIRLGKNVWEICPQMVCHKGTAVRQIAAAVKKFRGPRVQCLYLGDDLTDEDAFRELGANAVTVKISPRGSENSAARYFLRNSRDVFLFLQYLYRCRVEKEEGL